MSGQKYMNLSFKKKYYIYIRKKYIFAPQKNLWGVRPL